MHGLLHKKGTLTSKKGTLTNKKAFHRYDKMPSY